MKKYSTQPRLPAEYFYCCAKSFPTANESWTASKPRLCRVFFFIVLILFIYFFDFAFNLRMRTERLLFC